MKFKDIEIGKKFKSKDKTYTKVSRFGACTENKTHYFDENDEVERWRDENE